MDKEIFIALISLSGTLIAALIGLVSSLLVLKKQKSNNDISISELIRLLHSQANGDKDSNHIQYSFTEDDLQLQKNIKNKVDLIKNIIKNGINKNSSEKIFQIGINLNNNLSNYKHLTNIEQHIINIENFYEDMINYLISNSSNSPFESDVISAIGIITHNIKSGLNSIIK